MQFSSFGDFINMGGYGFYVWLSFGSATLILSLLLIISQKGHKQVISAITKRQAREAKIIKAKLSKTQQHITPVETSAKGGD